MGVEKQHVARGGKISFSEGGGGNKYRFRTEIQTPDMKTCEAKNFQFIFTHLPIYETFFLKKQFIKTKSYEIENQKYRALKSSAHLSSAKCSFFISSDLQYSTCKALRALPYFLNPPWRASNFFLRASVRATAGIPRIFRYT